MAKKDVWVSPRPDGKWEVQRQGADRVSSIHDTQADAFQQGRDTARREGVELFVQGRNGQIVERNSYGNDPYPPKG